MHSAILTITLLLGSGPLLYLLLPGIVTTPASLSEPRIVAIGPFQANLGIAPVTAMMMYIAATWTFSLHAQRHPMSKWYWPIWFVLFLSGLALVNFGDLVAGFLAIIGFALLARTYDGRKMILREGEQPPS
jgi:hypothetical protein